MTEAAVMPGILEKALRKSAVPMAALARATAPAARNKVGLSGKATAPC